MSADKPAPASAPKRNPLAEAAGRVAEELDADLVILVGGLYEPIDYDLYAHIQAKKKRPNVALFLATYGGSPDVAYRISRMLQKGFAKFTATVDAFCKSAGTLVVVGAHELVMSGRAELGPLDIQIGEIEEPKERKSGLTPIQALKILQEQAAQSYIGIFQTLNESLQIRAKTAVATSDQLISSLFARIYQQLDPIRLAEYERAMTIMMEYGQRLKEGGKNVCDGSLEKLVKEYPDHSFVIDQHEAAQLFHNVRGPSAAERELLRHLDGVFAASIDKKMGFVEYFAVEPEAKKEADGHDDAQEQSDGKQNGDVPPKRRSQRTRKSPAQKGKEKTEGEAPAAS